MDQPILLFAILKNVCREVRHKPESDKETFVSNAVLEGKRSQKMGGHLCVHVDGSDIRVSQPMLDADVVRSFCGLTALEPVDICLWSIACSDTRRIRHLTYM